MLVGVNIFFYLNNFRSRKGRVFVEKIGFQNSIEDWVLPTVHW